jgi:hypothetical protein
MHGYTLEVGAKPVRNQSLVSIVAARVGTGYETLKVF